MYCTATKRLNNLASEQETGDNYNGRAKLNSEAVLVFIQISGQTDAERERGREREDERESSLHRRGRSRSSSNSMLAAVNTTVAGAGTAGHGRSIASVLRYQKGTVHPSLVSAGAGAERLPKETAAAAVLQQ